MAKQKNVTADGRSVVITMKGSAAYAAWLKAIADRERVTMVQVLDKAVAEYAERHGYPAAPRRTER